MKVNIDPEVFNDVYINELDNMARTQIIFGGAASGKSVFKAQQVVIDLMRGGRNYLVCRQVGSTVRKSVFAEIQKAIYSFGVESLFNMNKSDGVITCSNGHQALFSGLDDAEKIKSITPAKGVVTDIWVEEATETDRRTIQALYKRQRGGSGEYPKRLCLTFNPILQSHWIFKEYFSGIGWADEQTEYKSEGLTILKTTYQDNKFLTPDDISDLENETDKYFYDVYTLGNWGVLGKVIFTNWSVRDLSDMRDQFTNHRNGLDFGYSADPAAMWVAHYDKMRKTIYIYDELYEKGLTNDLLANEIIQRVPGQRVVCDSADPKSIAELRQYGVHAVSAKKGPGSVLYGIQWLRQQTIIIDKRCVKAQSEFRSYKWAEDRSGEPVSPPKPAGTMDHIIDAGRYAHEEDMQSNKIDTQASVKNYIMGAPKKEETIPW